MKKRTYQMPDKDMIEVIEQDLRCFADKWRQDRTIGSPEPIDAFCDVMLRGGKRLRGVLAMQSYYAHGGQDDDVAIGAARVFELIQTSLLIVDDIADRSKLRRGGPSAHIRIEAFAHDNNMKGSASHYGLSQAMNVAYDGLHKATIELLNLPVDAETARLACRRFHENIATTINGQIDDIYNEMTVSEVTEQDIERVLIRKSAYYTILSPIELGATLAGKTELPKSLQEYSIHTGCAFQIADDIIGTFGTESETGKGHNDDIREGKMTLLAYYALKQASGEQKKFIQEVLGNENATSEQCDKIRDIFTATGALHYAKDRMKMHANQGEESLQNTEMMDTSFTHYLEILTDYLMDRRS